MKWVRVDYMYIRCSQISAFWLQNGRLHVRLRGMSKSFKFDKSAYDKLALALGVAESDEELLRRGQAEHGVYG